MKTEQKGIGQPTHGMSGTRIYKIWQGLKDRCLNTNTPKYDLYGGRGILVCREWMGFEEFYSDMRHGYSDDLTIDRINPDEGYNKSNCRWADNCVQSSNRRNVAKIVARGKSLSAAQWSREIGIASATINARRKAGWPPEMILSPTVRHGLRMKNHKKTNV